MNIERTLLGPEVLPRFAVTVTLEQLARFIHSTGDPNPIHDVDKFGDGAIVPGLQLGLIARRYVGLLLAKENMAPTHYFSGLRLKFDKPVPVESELLFCPMPLQGVDPLSIRLDVLVNNEIATSGILTYQSKPSTKAQEVISDETRYCTTTHSQELDAYSAQEVAISLGKVGADHQSLAVGRLSSVLYEHGLQLVKTFSSNGKQPVYFMQDFTFTPAFSDLNKGELMFIVTTKKADNKTCFMTGVSAYSGGTPVYTCKAGVKFVSPAQLGMPT